MSTYLKIVVIAAMFLSSGAASILGDSETSSPSTTDQQTVEQSSSKKAEESNHSTDASASSASQEASSVQSTKNSEKESVAQDSNEVATAASSSAEQDSATAPAVETAEANSRPAPTINEAAPASEPAAAPENQNAATPVPETMQADQLKVNGQLISYSNAGQGYGQSIIDANPNQVATWGGATVQSGNDGSNTHFIGHNPGIFNVLFSVGNGATIEVSDGSNNVTAYSVTHTVTVDDSGIAADGTDYWDQITGTGGGERITLQTCINDDYNLIVFASK